MKPHLARVVWLLGLLWTTSVSAQEVAAPSDDLHPASKSHAIEGWVIDEEFGQPIPFVRVTVAGTKVSAQTDAQGHFVLQTVKGSPLVLVVDDPIVRSLTHEVEDAKTSVVLRAIYRTDQEQTVTVQGVLSPTGTASQATVTARDIEAIPVRSAEDALRLVPGVTLVQHGSEGKGHQFFLRGFDVVHGTDLEITLEGIPLNEWSNVHGQGYLDLGFIVPEAISSLQATKGLFLDHQGAFAIAGSVDYHLGIPEEDLGVRATYIAGTTNRHRGVMTYSPRDDDGKDFIALEGMHDDSFGQNRAINRASLLTRWRLLDSPTDGTLSILGSGYLAAFELPGSVRNEDVQAGEIGFYDSYDDAGEGLSGRGLLALRYTRSRGDHDVAITGYGGYRRLELLENYTGFLIAPVDGDRRAQTQDTFNFGVTMEDTVKVSHRAAIHYGASVRGDVFEQTQKHLDQEANPIDVERSLDGLQTISSAYGSLRLRPLDPVSLTVGGRLDSVRAAAHDRLQSAASDAGTLFSASPRLTAGWKVLEPWQLFLSYGRGFRPPEARAFSSYEPPRMGISEELYDGGEPSMTLSDSLELGTQIQATKQLKMTASGFATFISREAVFDHVSGINLELNSTRRLGGELDLRYTPTHWLLLTADATLVDARFVESGNLVPFAPWLSGSVRAVVTHPSGWRAGMRFFGLAPRPLPHGARGAAMAVLDATLGYHWEHFHLDLEVENLLNQRVREGEYHHASNWDPEENASQLPVIHTVAGPPLNARLGFTVVY